MHFCYKKSIIWLPTDTKLIAAWLYRFFPGRTEDCRVTLFSFLSFRLLLFFFVNITDLFAFEILGSIFLVLHMQ